MLRRAVTRGLRIIRHESSDCHGRIGFSDVRGLSRLQCDPVRAGCCPWRGAVHRPVVGPTHVLQRVYGEDGRLCEKLFSGVHARRRLRQGVIELSGFSKSIVSAVIGVLGRERAVLSIVAVCAILTYGGVSLFVVVFAVYPFAAEMFRQSGIPKRLIPCTIALGAFTFTMDALPGTPQIQNIIPTTFFKTTTWAAPWLGLIGSLFVLGCGLAYIESRRRAAQARGEGYGVNLQNEPEEFEAEQLPNPLIALSPLVVVGVANFLLTHLI